MASISPPSPYRSITFNGDLTQDTRKDLGKETTEVLGGRIPDTNTKRSELLLRQIITYIQDPATKDQSSLRIQENFFLFRTRIFELEKSNRSDLNLKAARDIMKEDSHLLLDSVLRKEQATPEITSLFILHQCYLVSMERTPSSSSSNSTSITSTPSNIGQMVKDITGDSSGDSSLLR